AAGTAGLGNGKDGIFVNRADGVVIGGSNPAEGNLIGGNGGHGARLAKAKAATITGHLIGTNATIAPAKAPDRTYLASTISTPTRGNVTSGKAATGVELDRNSDDNRLEANKVGTKADGVTALGNGRFGVFVQNQSDRNTIGGTATGTGNIIAFNLKGVVIG